MSKRRNPITWVPSVYFGMGLPLISLSIVSVLMFTDLGIGKESITFWTSLLILPWSLKPIFSLVMEVFGTKRRYIFITEMITAVMFALICFALPLDNFYAYTLAFMGVIALAGSSHDIAGDGLYLQELSTEEQGVYAGWQGAFYNLAKILANGGLVFLAGYLSKSYGIKQAWIVVMGICAVLMGLLSLYHFFILPKEDKAKLARQETKPSLQENLNEFKEIFLTFFKKKYIFLYLFFILAYRFAEGFAMKIAPIFLKDAWGAGGLGLSNEEYGIIYGTAGTLAFIIGSILAGNFVARLGLRKTLFSLVLVFNIPFIVYLVLAVYQPESIYLIGTGIVFEYFSYGFGFVGLMLFMMQQIAPGKYQMAHYAFANSLMNLSVMLPGMLSGWLCDKLGYEYFFIVVMLCTIPAILMAFKLPFAYDAKSETEE